MGGFQVFASVLLLTPPQQASRVLAKVPATIDADNGWAVGASRLPGDAGLIYKVVGAHLRQVRERVREFWSVVRLEVTGAPLSDTRRWR